MFNGQPGWESEMTRWRVDVVAIPNDAPLASVISHATGWERIYAGDDGSVYVAAPD
jgi:hypothetical protein